MEKEVNEQSQWQARQEHSQQQAREEQCQPQAKGEQGGVQEAEGADHEESMKHTEDLHIQHKVNEECIENENQKFSY